MHNAAELRALRLYADDVAGLFARVTEDTVLLASANRAGALRLIRPRVDEPLGEYVRPTKGKQEWTARNPKERGLDWDANLGLHDEPHGPVSHSTTVFGDRLVEIATIAKALKSRSDEPLLRSTIVWLHDEGRAGKMGKPPMRLTLGDGTTHASMVIGQLLLDQPRPPAQAEAMKQLVAQLRERKAQFVIRGSIVATQDEDGGLVEILTDYTGKQWVQR